MTLYFQNLKCLFNMGSQVLWPLVRFPQNKEILSPNLSAQTKTSQHKHLQPSQVCASRLLMKK